MRWLLACLSLMLLGAQAVSAEISVFKCNNDCGMYGGYVVIEGEIANGDLAEIVARYAAEDRSGLPYATMLDSPGGDVAEAMAIGLWARANTLAVAVSGDGSCASACVLILAAGIAKFPNGEVRIHRPYLRERGSRGSGDEMRELLARLRGYLEHVNIPPALADEMFSIPPTESIRLTARDLRRYRLDQPDIGYLEDKHLKEAELLGISRDEYLVRMRRMQESGEFERCQEILDAAEMFVCSLRVQFKYGLTTMDSLRRGAPPRDRPCPFPPEHEVADPFDWYPNCENRRRN